MRRYFVAVYVNPVKPLGAPILIKKVAEHLTMDEAESLVTAKNVEAGHVCDDVELKLSHPAARYFMYDDEYEQ